MFGFGFSAGEARVLDNGDIQVFDLSGSVGNNTPVADRNIDLNVYTFKTDGSAEVETIGMPQTFAFGYSAGESVKINDYGHQVVAYDGGAYVLFGVIDSIRLGWF